ncbi:MULTISPECIES: DMT family transporter [unclassified Pseudomonas]|uniref:DMT family transporter n=1 Tax=unclassified Pseudomonas TaxID=196821 RepID=UPI0017800BCC|nr:MULTISPECIES: DMT family transporter [unclassified Pseudomonas]MBD8729609.1 DMT family transporter [Pseudomonas sp. CFBP 13710]MBD8825465.1 DMT family transporter [Pseudomonas sp. CFBP 13602]
MNASATRPVSQFLSDPRTVLLLATLCCALWGSSYPAIKNGYELLQIAPNDVPSKLIFAGYRFLLAGLCLLLLAVMMGKPVLRLSPRTFGQVALLGLVQTGLQYVFFYIGLAYTTGVRASILNATTTFFSVLLAHFVYHNDKLSMRKSVGCLLGFAGVLTVNAGAGPLDALPSVHGEGFIVIAAFVLSAASIYGKYVSHRMDAMVMTGWQLAVGGLALLVGGYATGGTLGHMTATSTLLLIYLALLSAVAFTLWSLLLKYNPVGRVSVFAFLVPVFGAGLSAMFLGESIFEWKNLAALVLVCVGIALVTRAQVPGVASKAS